MKKIIFDCDNTFGIQGCDVDDGLTLLYLLGNENAELLGVTTTYGNNLLETVYDNTKKMLKEIHHPEIVVKKGGELPGEWENEASRYMVMMADRYPGEISILATGSMTNLGGAYELDHSFFEKVKEVVLMGGITQPLIFEKKEMQELNLSCDPTATHHVLTKGHHVSVVTGNNCLKVLFTRKEYQQELTADLPIIDFIKEKTDYWFDDNEIDYGIKGFYNWDVTAGVYLMHPELFEDKCYHMNITKKDLETGFLREVPQKEENCVLNLPEIGEEQPFKQNIYSTWMKVRM